MYHYTVDGQQMGPVTEDQLRQMVAFGTLSGATLVWREGMAEWQPISAVLSGISGGVVQCSVCRQSFPADQTIQVSGQAVCAGCKPAFVQGMREGAVGVGAGMPLYEIAKRQRVVVMCFGLLLACNLGSLVMSAVAPPIAPLLSLVSIVVMLFGIVAIYRLARSLRLTAIVYVIAMILPCVNLLVLLLLVSKASKVLKDAGVKVGFFGVSKETIESLRGS